MADSNGVEIKVKINEAQIQRKIDNGASRAQIALDNQVLKDSNYYCPQDTGNLRKSAILSSVLGSGLITWRTPYARAQYYGLPNKSLIPNPNARVKWFEVAKSKNLKNWEKIANDEFNKNNK